MTLGETSPAAIQWTSEDSWQPRTSMRPAIHQVINQSFQILTFIAILNGKLVQHQFRNFRVPPSASYLAGFRSTQIKKHAQISPAQNEMELKSEEIFATSTEGRSKLNHTAHMQIQFDLHIL